MKTHNATGKTEYCVDCGDRIDAGQSHDCDSLEMTNERKSPDSPGQHMTHTLSITRSYPWRCACGAIVAAGEAHGVDQGCQFPQPVPPDYFNINNSSLRVKKEKEMTREDAILLAEENGRLPRAAFEAVNECSAELSRAIRKHGAMRGPHEGYAVILEELDELWAEIKRRDIDYDAMRKEAIQVAAMAMRFVADVCGSKGQR